MKMFIATVLAIMLYAQLAASCCDEVRVRRNTGGDLSAQKEQAQLFQKYEKTRGEIDGKDWWLSRDEEYAIWYTDGKWRIGHTNRVGSTTRNADTTDDDKCVEDTGLTWKFFNGDEDHWYDADDGLGVYCEFSL